VIAAHALAELANDINIVTVLANPAQVLAALPSRDLCGSN